MWLGWQATRLVEPCQRLPGGLRVASGSLHRNTACIDGCRASHPSQRRSTSRAHERDAAMAHLGRRDQPAGGQGRSPIPARPTRLSPAPISPAPGDDPPRQRQRLRGDRRRPRRRDGDRRARSRPPGRSCTPNCGVPVAAPFTRLEKAYMFARDPAMKAFIDAWLGEAFATGRLAARARPGDARHGMSPRSSREVDLPPPPSLSRPRQGQGVNWLPASKDEFILMLRLYWPKEKPPSIIDGSWKFRRSRML